MSYWFVKLPQAYPGSFLQAFGVIFVLFSYLILITLYIYFLEFF